MYHKIIISTISCLLPLVIMAGVTSISPNPTMVGSAEAFEVQVTVDEDMLEFRGYKLVFSYDEDMLEFVSAEKGPLMDGFLSYWWQVFDVSADSLHIECSGFGYGLSVSGPGCILILKFQPKQQGECILHFKEEKFYDTDGYIMENTSTEDGLINIDYTMGMASSCKEESCTVFPNPFSSSTHIDLYNYEPDDIIIELINTSGSVVRSLWTARLPEGLNHFELDAEGLNDGLYILQIRNSKEIKTYKVIHARF